MRELVPYEIVEIIQLCVDYADTNVNLAQTKNLLVADIGDERTGCTIELQSEQDLSREVSLSCEFMSKLVPLTQIGDDFRIYFGNYTPIYIECVTKDLVGVCIAPRIKTGD